MRARFVRSSAAPLLVVASILLFMNALSPSAVQATRENHASHNLLWQGTATPSPTTAAATVTPSPTTAAATVTPSSTTAAATATRSPTTAAATVTPGPTTAPGAVTTG